MNGHLIIKFIIKAGGVVLVLLFLLWGFIRFYQARGIYFPDNNVHRTPAGVELEYRDTNLKAEDGTKLHGWYIPYKNSEKILIYFHGNAGNISHRLERLKLLNSLKLNVFIIDYRGYGKSQGKPTEKGLYKDARAAYRHVKETLNFCSENIVIYGKSLGGNVAIDLAADIDEGILISESAFTSALEMGELVLPFVPRFLLELFVTVDYNASRRIKKVIQPKLIIHSREDQVTPYFMGEKLFEIAPEPKKFHSMRGRHNQTSRRELINWLKCIDEFIKNRLPNSR